MSGVAKGIGKGLKKLWKGVTKVFKKVWDSKIGRVVLIAAAIFVGGAYLGMWQPGLFGGGGLGTAASAGGQTAALAAGTQPVAAGAAAAEATGAAAKIGAVAGAAPDYSAITAAAQQAGGGAAAVAPGTAAATEAAGTAVASTAPDYAALTAGLSDTKTAVGIVERIKGLASGVSKFIGKNPELSLMGAAAAAGALSPDPAEQERKFQNRLRQRRERNLDTSNISLSGLPSSNQPLARPGGESVFDDRGFRPSPMAGIVQQRLGARA